MANVKKKQTREERLEKKRQTEKLRYQRIKKRSEKGQIKSINDMTEREQRAVRKIWREKTKKHRDRVKIQSTRNNPLTPPASDNEDQPPLPQNNIALAAKRRSEIQRKLRNQLIKKQKYEIKQLRQKVRDCQKKLRRIGKQKMTPNSKVADLLQNNSKENIEEVKKKLLFSEVIQNQLKENINLTTNDNEKKIFKKVLSGKVVKKYKVLNQINMKPIRQSSTANKSLLDMTRKTRNDKTNSKLEKKVAEFFEEDCNSRLCPEVQSFHFGGSRTQISLHTVVLYTKGETKCFATMSENLNHNVPVIWAHLKPVMKLLPSSVENVHFLSDGPVTQYRNKDMFFYLLCKLTETYPNIYDFTWNYHEAGHGKGAPDGIGGTCKRTADKIVALGTDIATIDDFATELNKSCPGIKIFVIPEEEIDFQKKIMEDNRPNIKPFTGTLKVHQVRGNYLRNTLYMKSLSCFCSNFCPHFHLGDIKYPQNKKNKLDVDAVYTDSEEDVQNKIVAQTSTHVINTIDNADTAMTVKNGDFVLVEYNINNKKYRYAGVCSSDFDEEEGEIRVTFLKISNEDATFFRINDNDVSDVKWEQILTILPVPNIRMKGNRVFYKFPKPVDVFEK
ncbi:unnamed protein product [Pieris macdunnoughi]|uniref:Uncharacterized protein n=1 Tax=Pieris macdunnoughi TaxID=345717 RepID=A0A821XB08_9NEOP|nr:unnamed protein product [Pieris macdunnoughi]